MHHNNHRTIILSILLVGFLVATALSHQNNGRVNRLNLASKNYRGYGNHRATKGKGQTFRASEVPYGRPEPSERKFNSTAVEDTIVDVGSRIADDTIRQIFTNCLPSTLDTTIYYHVPRGINTTIPYTYIVTGDIPAMWLRDSTYQVNPYVRMASREPALEELILGVINTQAEMINLYPWANAYFPLEHWNSGIKLDPSDWSLNDTVYPSYNRTQIFEAKYELDSLASFLWLSKYFFESTNNAEFVENPHWVNATWAVLDSMRAMQAGTVESLDREKYTFTRPSRTQSETQNLYGKGNPVRRCGLIRSFFRPSDDSTIFQYLIPSNAMAVVGLEGVAHLLDISGRHPEMSEELRALAWEVRNAISQWGIVTHPTFGRVYAFEVDCFGSHAFMDDANFPSLLSLPRFGFVTKSDPVYLNTRKYILHEDYNPYFAQGRFPGVGSPHTGLQKPWHMAQAMQGMTSNNETEIAWVLQLLRNSTGGTGFMHESYNVDNPNSFTRDWFAWANTVFGDFILYLDEEYPHLLQSVGHFKIGILM